MKRSLARSLIVLFIGVAALGVRVGVTRAASHTDAAAATYGAATLGAIGRSKVMGAAAIYGSGGGLIVAVAVSGLTPMSRHAEHIHAGACGSNGPITYPLADLVADAHGNATAVSHIPATSVARSGWYVNVHNNDATLTVLACGTVRRAGMDVTLTAVGGGHGHGMGLISTVAAGTEVVVYVTHLGGAGVHPEHLHAGHCGSNGAITYPLTNLTTNAKGDGIAVTLIKGMIPRSGLYLNVHASATNLAVVACGNLGGTTSSSSGQGGY